MAPQLTPSQARERLERVKDTLTDAYRKLNDLEESIRGITGIFHYADLQKEISGLKRIIVRLQVRAEQLEPIESKEPAWDDFRVIRN